MASEEAVDVAEPKKIPDSQFKALAAALKNLDNSITLETKKSWSGVGNGAYEFKESVINVSDKAGNKKQLFTVPENFRVMPYRKKSDSFIRLIDRDTGLSASEIKIPSKYSTISVRSTLSRKNRGKIF
jgi:hypothetical protein